MPKRSFVLASSLSLSWFAGCTDLPSRSQQTDASTQVESSNASSPVAAPAKANYELRMHQLHTGESVDVVYRRVNQYLVGAITQLNHLLRDYRTGQDAHYPVREFDLLHALMQRLCRPKGVIDVVCGYRSPWSNQSCAAGERTQASRSIRSTSSRRLSISGYQGSVRHIARCSALLGDGRRRILPAFRLRSCRHRPSAIMVLRRRILRASRPPALAHASVCPASVSIDGSETTLPSTANANSHLQLLG